MAALCGIALILPMRAACCAAEGNASATTQETAISALISDLSADDSAARKAAGEKLVELGLAGRAQVLEATHSDDPEIRAQAIGILMKLPWSQSGDLPAVKEILDHYVNYVDQAELIPGGNPGLILPPAAPQQPPTEQNRCDAVGALAILPDFEGFDALIRLVHEDPADLVRWSIVHVLRTTDDGSHLAKLRLTNPPPGDAPLTALCGLAWLAADSPRAEPLLAQAVRLAYKNPTPDDGELDFVVGLLVDLETADKKYDDAAKVLREELKHTTPTDSLNVPVPLARLFALHANFGPLAGFNDDVQRAGDFLSTPKLQYAMARVALRQGNTRKAASGRKDAFDAGGNWRAGRFETGKYLAENGWNEEAEAEFKAYLAMPAGHDAGDTEGSDVNAHFALSDLAAGRGDDFTAAEEKKAAMSILGGGTNAPLEGTDALGHAWPITEDSIWAEVHWLYLKAALKRKDEPAVGAELKELIQLKPTDEDMAIDVVPMLKAHGQADAADQLFAGAYKVVDGKLAVDPTNPSLMNGMAWLEAKCDENLPEALRLASSAVAADPDNSAMIDTLAEVNFHLGNFQKAVDLETRALKLTPGDTFMAGQLERFKGGFAK